MPETQHRSLLERLVGRPLPWLAFVWAALAAIWIVLAFVDPSRTHTFMAILWTVLAAVQITAVVVARRQHRNRLRHPDEDSGTRS